MIMFSGCGCRVVASLRRLSPRQNLLCSGFLTVDASCRDKTFCTNYGYHGQKNDVSVPARYLGQPTPYTHSHLLKTDEITPAVTRQEYTERRRSLMAALGRSSSGEGKHHVAVVLAADRKYMTDDIPYPFRQSTNFLYLTGFQEPDSALVLESVPGQPLPEHRATLFVQQRDPERELWDGPRAGTEGALRFLGVDESQPLADFGEKLHSLAHQRPEVAVWYDVFKPANAALHEEVRSHLVQPCRSRGHTVNILENVLHAQRLSKSPAEQHLMRESARIAAGAIRDAMAASHAGVDESALFARLHHSCLLAGAQILAYPPVIAGGDRANVLHYTSNNQVVRDGELVLMDAGCEYHGYASDITRTWPVGGRFTGPQAELYQATLDVQRDCIEMCTVGRTLDQVYHFMLVELGAQLQELGILPAGLAEWDLCKRTKQYCPHHVSHYLGMDTHDTGRVSRSGQLQSGMVVTVEPGLYIPESDTSAPAKYRGIGIRIEDDVLITPTGPDVLSKDCPKEIEDIERLMEK